MEGASNSPTFIYGTAWKEDATTELVKLAVRAGFRAIDTANQPWHYQEALVGDALKALADEGIARSSLFVQTKFTPVDGHDHRVPYDPELDLKSQVAQSFESSLRHLNTDYLDSYVLHGPYSSRGLGNSDWEVWGAIEEIHRSGRARMIGISNVKAEQLDSLVTKARTKPMVVQNRCYANRGWDREVREICRENGIAYQGFSLLTANRNVVRHPIVVSVARRLSVQPEQVVFRFAMQVGIVPLTGTKDEVHMREDLGVFAIRLTREEVELIESIEGLNAGRGV
jgi:diketogulonate reductase-like aldo/keto reductase